MKYSTPLKARVIWSGDGTVVRALASHHCGLGSIPGPDVTFEFFMVLDLALRVFLQVLRFSTLCKYQHSLFQFDLETVNVKSHLVECPLLHFHLYFHATILK